MTKPALPHDDSGYLSNRPFGPDRWAQIGAGQPAGKAIAINALPPGFLMVQNALDAATCNAIVAECNQAQGVRSTIAVDAGADGLSDVKSSKRTSDFIDTRPLKADISGIMRDMFMRFVVPHFGGELDWYELPEILRYGVGGEYVPHADAENWDKAKKEWRREKDRDLSILLYLNEGFKGGEIDFPNFGMKLPPRRGMLVAFPSDNHYIHAARPVTQGVRYVAVCWAAVKGTPRVLPEPPVGATRV